MYRYFLFILVAFLAVACSRYSRDIEYILRMAGENRGKLEQVLAHYGNNPADN